MRKRCTDDLPKEAAKDVHWLYVRENGLSNLKYFPRKIIIANCVLIIAGIALVPLQLLGGDTESVWVAVDLGLMTVVLIYIEYVLWSRSRTIFIFVAPVLMGLLVVTGIYVGRM